MSACGHLPALSTLSLSPHCPGCHHVTCHVSRCAGSVTANICRGFLTQADTGTAATQGKLQQQPANLDTTLDKRNIHPPACSRGTRNRAAAVILENVGRLDDGDNHCAGLHYSITLNTAAQRPGTQQPAQSSPG